MKKVMVIIVALMTFMPAFGCVMFVCYLYDKTYNHVKTTVVVHSSNYDSTHVYSEEAVRLWKLHIDTGEFGVE